MGLTLYVDTTQGTGGGRHGGKRGVSGASGDIEIRHAEDSVTATTAHGALRVDEVVRGAVKSETCCGAVNVHIRTRWGGIGIRRARA